MAAEARFARALGAVLALVGDVEKILTKKCASHASSQVADKLGALAVLIRS